MGAIAASILAQLLSTGAIEMIIRNHQRVAYEWKKLCIVYGALVILLLVALCCLAGVVPYLPGLMVRVALLVGFGVIWARIVGTARLRNIWERTIAKLISPRSQR